MPLAASEQCMCMRVGGAQGHTCHSRLPRTLATPLRPLTTCTAKMAAPAAAPAASKPQDAASFVAALTAVPVRDAVTAAAAASRTRLTRALELLQASAALLDAAKEEAAAQATAAAAMRSDMARLKEEHVQALQAARADSAAKSQLSHQAEVVRAPPAAARLPPCTAPTHAQYSEKISDLETELRERDTKLAERVRGQRRRAATAQRAHAPRPPSRSTKRAASSTAV